MILYSYMTHLEVLMSLFLEQLQLIPPILASLSSQMRVSHPYFIPTPQGTPTDLLNFPYFYTVLSWTLFIGPTCQLYGREKAG